MNNVRSTQKALACLMTEGDGINEYCVVFAWNTNVTQQIRSPAESILMWLLERSLSGAEPEEDGEPLNCFKTCISQQQLFSDQHVLFEIFAQSTVSAVVA